MLAAKEYFTIGEATNKLGFAREMLLRPEWHLVFSPKFPVLGFFDIKFVLRLIAGLMNDGDLVLFMSNLFVTKVAGLSIGLTNELLIGGLCVFGCFRFDGLLLPEILDIMLVCRF